MKSFTLLFAGVFLLACQPSQQENFETKNKQIHNSPLKQSVIYGNDDRKDMYEVLNPDWLNRAKATVALMAAGSLIDKITHYEVKSDTFGGSYGLCESEPYKDQPNPAFCSGSLIEEDLIMTAGHCVSDTNQCQGIKFVFDYGIYAKTDDMYKVDKASVYSCDSVIVSQVNGDGSDFAIIKLTKKVVNRTPLPYRKTGTINDANNLVVIGHPVGLPTKLAGGAKVRDNLNQGYFSANLDTYGGNSGSAVFNGDNGNVEGILVRGAQDFDFSGSCTKSFQCTDSGCMGEDVTRVSNILPFIPKATTPPAPIAASSVAP